MWLLCTAFSLVLTVAHIWYRASERKGSALLLVLSLLSVTFNLLSIYNQISEWVWHQDWSALEDVVPAIQPILFFYVMLIILINLLLYHGNKGYKAYK